MANDMKTMVTPRMREAIDQSLRRMRIPLRSDSSLEEFRRYIDA